MNNLSSHWLLTPFYRIQLELELQIREIVTILFSFLLSNICSYFSEATSAGLQLLQLKLFYKINNPIFVVNSLIQIRFQLIGAKLCS